MAKNKNIPPKVELSAKTVVQKENKVFTEQVIKEIKVQKNINRDEALKILETYHK